MENRPPKMKEMPWANLRLPPFPQVALRVLQLVHNENVQQHQLAELIASDPAFASEVLTVANSALYALRYPAHSILQAVNVLGGDTLQGMCVTVGVRAYLGKSMGMPSMKKLWRHNLACAVIAKKFGACLSMDVETAYTAGILHDVGRAALAVIQPKEYSKLLASHAGTPESMLEGERDLFGMDHCETGLRLMKGWKLPQEFEDVVARHHCDEERGGEWGLGRVIQESCQLADVAGFPAFAQCLCKPYEELRAKWPEAVCAKLAPEAKDFSAEIAESIAQLEKV